VTLTLNAGDVSEKSRAVEVGFRKLKSEFVFSFFLTYCVNNLIKIIFKYELQFVAFTWPNICSLDLSLLFLCACGS